MRNEKTEYTEQKRELAARAAVLYYEYDKNQSDIAAQLGISRSYVSQLLTMAKELGMVNITLNVDRSLEEELYYTRAFGIRHAYILPSEDAAFTEANIGRFAARYITRLVRGAEIIGVNLGNSIRMAIRELNPADFSGAGEKCIVQMMGGYSSSEGTASVLPGELVHALGDVVGGRCFYLNCPAVVGSAALKTMICAEPSIREVSTYWEKLDLALMGLGTVSNRSRTMALLEPAAASGVTESGAVCDININFFDQAGAYLPILEDRRIGLSYDQLKQVKTKVVVCFGADKVVPAAAGIRSGMIDVLITDSITARAVHQLLTKGEQA